jgi:glycosyltransferase involved in cell wall biosynthesis
MRIIHIVPGSGDQFYCQNCMRDNSLVAELKDLGHEAKTIPMYLPLSPDDRNQSDYIPVFYGAINVYLKQMLPLYRHVPEWIERFFDSRYMLNYAAKKSGSTSASGLEEMTLSMLRGEAGNQSSELSHLIHWLKLEGRPDVVHLSNSLLLGLAHQIRMELDVPVVCSLQDENQWIDPMRDEYRQQVWDIMAEKAHHVDAFVAVSSYYASVMQDRLHLPDLKMHVVHIGINLDEYSAIQNRPDPPVIGFLSRLSECHGLGLLVDAFLKLKNQPQFKNLQLHLTGGYSHEDQVFFNEQLNRVKKAASSNDVKIFQDFDRASRISFLQNLSLLSVPVIGGEAFGTYLLESLACAVPVVQPEAGAFTELVQKLQGGILYHPNTSDALAQAIEKLLSSPPLVQKFGLKGRANVMKHFSIQEMARKTLNVYQQVVKDYKQA